MKCNEQWALGCVFVYYLGPNTISVSSFYLFVKEIEHFYFIIEAAFRSLSHLLLQDSSGPNTVPCGTPNVFKEKRLLVSLTIRCAPIKYIIYRV